MEAYAAVVAARSPFTFEQVWQYHQQWCVNEGKSPAEVKSHERNLNIFVQAAGLTMQSLAGPSLTTDFRTVCSKTKAWAAQCSLKEARARLIHLERIRRGFEGMIGLREPDYISTTFSYRLLEVSYRAYLASEGLAVGTIGNRLRSLRHWRACFGLGEDSLVEDELLDPAKFALRQTQFVAWCQNEKKPKDEGHTLFDRDSHAADAHRAACSLALVNGRTTVGKALRSVLLASAGSVRNFIRLHPGVPNIVQDYCAGRLCPSREFLAEIERLTQIASGTLTTLLPTPVQRRMAIHLPSTLTGRVLHRLTKQSYSLSRKLFPDTLRQQLAAYTCYKVARASDLNGHQRRRSWTCVRVAGRMDCPSGEIFWQAMESFMGWLHHDRGVPLRELNFASVSRSDLILEFVDFLADRREMVTATVTKFLHIPLELLSEGWGFIFQDPTLEAGLGLNLDEAGTWASLLPLCGRIQEDARTVEVAASLAGGDIGRAPVCEHLLDQHSTRCVEHAAMSGRVRWESWCRVNRLRISAGYAEREARRQIGRSPQERAIGLLDLERPDLALLNVIHQQIAAVPPAHTKPRTRWEHARDSVLALVAYFTAFRQKEFRECEFIPSRYADENIPWQDRGGLQFNAGQYEIWVRVSKLKNGPFLKERHPQGYVKREIPTIYNSIIESYLHLRAEVLAQAPLPAKERHSLFFTWEKNHGTTSMMNCHNVADQLIKTIFVHGGEVLARGLNPHAFRHVRATGLIKAGEKIEKVAYLLCDKVGTVYRYYKHWMSVEQQQMAEMHTRMALECEDTLPKG